MNLSEAAVSKKERRAGYFISGLPVLFLFLDAIGKLVKPESVVAATVDLGYQEGVILPLGIVLLACTVLYSIPRTNVLGAILLTGYLGGAVATHVRIGAGLFPVIFPAVIGILLWMGVYLRNNRVRDLIPLRS